MIHSRQAVKIIGVSISSLPLITHKFFKPTEVLFRGVSHLDLNSGEISPESIQEGKKQGRFWEFLGMREMPSKREISEVNSLPVIIDKNGKPTELAYFLHCRPPLLTGETKGAEFIPNGKDLALSIESSAGGVKTGESPQAAATRELEEELGITPKTSIELSPNITHDPGAFISRVSRYIMNIGTSIINPQKADPTQLAIIKVPIKDAMKYLYQQAQKGINVSAQSILTTLETLSHYGIDPSTNKGDKDVKAKLAWSAFQNTNNQNDKPLSFVQKLFKSLAEKFPQSTGDFSLKFLQASS